MPKHPKTGNLLNIKAYSEYDGTTEIVFQGEFEDFLIAFFKEYERYFKGILQKDSNTIQHKSVEMMERQLKVYKALEKESAFLFIIFPDASLLPTKLVNYSVASVK